MQQSRLNLEGATFIGIEIDSRAISDVLLNLDMQVTHRHAEATGPNFHDPQVMQAKIAEVAQTLAAKTNQARLYGLGLAIPGLVGREGQVVNAPILGWRNFAMQTVLRHSLPGTWAVEVCNDAFAFASAELAGPDGAPLNLLMVLLAEGAGSAHVAGGRLITGAQGFAGELGHKTVTVRGRTAKFEALAGAAGFADVMGQGRAVADGVAALLSNPNHGAALDLWAGSRRWAALATGLANAAHLLDPAGIVLGGSLAALYPSVAQKVESHLAALMLQGHARPTLHLARRGAEAAAIDAAARLRERVFALPDLHEAMAHSA